MNKETSLGKKLYKLLTYLLVAAIASAVTYYFCLGETTGSKLIQLEKLILECFVGDADRGAMEDAAADAMVNATGDRWSYYIPASQYEAYMEQMQNAYVGIGVTIATKAGEKGHEILQTQPTGGAHEAGILPGDILVAVEQKNVLEIGLDAASELIRGEEGTQVELSVLRGEETLTFVVTRKTIQVVVAKGEMLENNIGLVTIANFDERCADETLAAIEMLVEQGAKGLIFDVRFNPGGYKKELVKVLDYLLPEGTIFHSVSYDGKESKTKSDANCLELPMAVLINADSYSAAEFFAAALEEYDWAVTVGEPTVGKGYFQSTFSLQDGSAVNLSIGKYYTPNGISLADVGGLQPNVQVKLDDEAKAKLYAGVLAPTDDPQILAAMEALDLG